MTPGSCLGTLLALATFAIQGVAAGDDAALHWLTQPLPPAVNVRLRATSQTADGTRMFADLDLEYRRSQDASELFMQVAARRQPRRSFHLWSDAAGGVTIKETVTETHEAVAEPAVSIDSRVPGTLLPWRVLTLGWREGFRVDEDSDSNDVVIAGGSSPDGSTPAEIWHLRLDAETREPKLLVQLDNAGRTLTEIKLLELRDTAWGRAVVRSIYHDVATGERVLLEIRGGRVLTPERASEAGSEGPSAS